MGAAGHALIASGIGGDGVSTVIAGVVCSFGVAIGPANAGLVAATGVASRVIAYPIAAILILAAIMPVFAGLLTVMPPPVMASGLLFAAAFIMINGVQIISSRVLDARRTVVIGAGVLTFLLVAIFPATFANAPSSVQSIVGSPLVLATIVALTLNLVFRIGIKRSVELVVDHSAAQHEDVENFVERNAGGWGARRDVIARAKFTLMQAVEAVTEAMELAASDPSRHDLRRVRHCGEAGLSRQAVAAPDVPPSADEIYLERRRAFAPRWFPGQAAGRPGPLNQ